jgi:hypothetical protein
MFGRKIFEKYANFALLFVGNEKEQNISEISGSHGCKYEDNSLLTKYYGKLVNTPASYSRGPGFKFGPETGCPE